MQRRAIVALLCAGDFFLASVKSVFSQQRAHDLNSQRLSTAERHRASICSMLPFPTKQPTIHPSLAFCARRPYKNNKNLSTHQTEVNRPIEKWYKV